MSTCSLIKFDTNDGSFGERWGPFCVPRHLKLCVCADSVLPIVSCVSMRAHSHLSVSFRCVRIHAVVQSSVWVHLFLHLISNEQLLIASPSCAGGSRQRLRLSQPVNNYRRKNSLNVMKVLYERMSFALPHCHLFPWKWPFPTETDWFSTVTRTQLTII